MNPQNNSIDAYIDSVVAGAKQLIVAGSGTDNSAVTGTTIDRNAYNSGVFSIGYIATLAATKTLTITVTEQQSDDNSTWDTATAFIAATVVLTGASGGSTNSTGVTTLGVNLAGKKRYIRYNVTADLSATSADTAQWVATFIKGGAVEKPAS